MLQGEEEEEEKGLVVAISVVSDETLQRHLSLSGDVTAFTLLPVCD